jgi:hypothetical protein
MTKVTALTEIDSVADEDVLYIWDASTPAAPDKKVPFSKIRPPGVRITNNLRYEGNVNIPALAAGVEGDATIVIAGAAVGDHLVFNLAAALPGNIAVLHAWVSAADTATVRFRNTHASAAYAGAAIACVALASRSTA